MKKTIIVFVLVVITLISFGVSAQTNKNVPMLCKQTYENGVHGIPSGVQLMPLLAAQRQMQKLKDDGLLDMGGKPSIIYTIKQNGVVGMVIQWSFESQDWVTSFIPVDTAIDRPVDVYAFAQYLANK